MEQEIINQIKIVKNKYKQQYFENILFIINLKLLNFVCVTVYAYLFTANSSHIRQVCTCTLVV